MAISEDTLALPKIQQSISRRAVMRTGFAATALSAVPALGPAVQAAAVPDYFDHEFEAIVLELEAHDCTTYVTVAQGGYIGDVWVSQPAPSDLPDEVLTRFRAIDRERRKRHLLATGRFLVWDRAMIENLRS